MCPDKARGTYYGQYKAIVYDNNDPHKTGRLRLIIPAVYGKDLISDWSLPACGALTGEGLGEFKIPDKDATVWVFFENGSSCNPVWWGGWWGFPKGVSDIPLLAKGVDAGGKTDESAKLGPKGTDTMRSAAGPTLSEPPPPYAAKYPSNRVLVTKSGIRIEIDDTEGQERVHVWHPTQTWQERHPDGTMVERHKNQRWVTVEAGATGTGDDRLHVYGDQDIVVEGNATLRTLGDYRLEVDGNFYCLVRGETQWIHQKDFGRTVVGDKRDIIGKNSVRYARGKDIRIGHPVDEVSA